MLFQVQCDQEGWASHQPQRSEKLHHQPYTLLPCYYKTHTLRVCSLGRNGMDFGRNGMIIPVGMKIQVVDLGQWNGMNHSYIHSIPSELLNFIPSETCGINSFCPNTLDYIFKQTNEWNAYSIPSLFHSCSIPFSCSFHSCLIPFMRSEHNLSLEKLFCCYSKEWAPS